MESRTKESRTFVVELSEEQPGQLREAAELEEAEPSELVARALRLGLQSFAATDAPNP